MPTTAYRSFFRMLLLAGLALAGSGCRQVVLRVQEAPSNTPANASLFVAGDFNYWDAGDREFKLQRAQDGTWLGTLPLGWGKLNYKFTRGDWTTAEADRCGHELPNRLLDYLNAPDTVDVQIHSWQDLGPTQCNRVVLRLRQLPAETPTGARIFLASNYNNWLAFDTAYAFKRGPAGTWLLAVQPQADPLEFKLTRGSWDAEAVGPEGEQLGNQQLVLGTQDTVDLQVAAWMDIDPGLLPGKRTLQVQVPAYTPPDAEVYLAGNFNKWNPRDSIYRLRRVKTGLYTITLTKGQGELTYKFTRGSWGTEEVDVNRNPTANHRLRRGPGLVPLEVEAWKDIVPKPEDAPFVPEPLAPPPPRQVGIVQAENTYVTHYEAGSPGLEASIRALEVQLGTYATALARLKPGPKRQALLAEQAAVQAALAELNKLAQPAFPQANLRDGFNAPAEVPLPKGQRGVLLAVADEPPFNRQVFVQLALPGRPGENYGFAQKPGTRVFKMRVPVGTLVYACDGPYWDGKKPRKRLVAKLSAEPAERVFTAKALQY